MEVMIQAAVLVTAILAIRKIFGEKLHAYIRYSLWLFVVVRLLIPVNFINSPFSVLRIGNILAEQNAENSNFADAPDDVSEKDNISRADDVPAADDASKADGTSAADNASETDGSTEALPANRSADDNSSMSKVGEKENIFDKGALADGPADSIQNIVTGQQIPGSDGIMNPDNQESYTGTDRLREERETVFESGKTAVSESTFRQAGGIRKWIGNTLSGENARKMSEKVTGIFRVIWIAGSIFVGGFLAAAQIRFRSRLHRMRKPNQSSLKEKETINDTHDTRSFLRKNHMDSDRAAGIPVYYVDGLESPCLAGVIHPAVYVGSDIKKDSDYFRYTVMHEKVHYLHGDHIWAVVRAVLVSLYWFHPFVWIAAAASARDGEIACDYGTVCRLGDGERMAYGTMLLDLSGSNGGKRMYSYGTMLRSGRSEMKERILRLAGGNRSRMSAGILGILLMLVMAGCAFTGVSQNDRENGINPAVGEDAVPGEDGENVSGDTRGDMDNSGTNNIENTVNGSGSQNENSSGDGSASGDVNLSGNESTDNSENAVNTSTFDPDDIISGQRQLAAVPAALSEELLFGVDGPVLDYAGRLGTGDKNVIIFHDYFGLVVYDLTNSEVVRSLDLARIDCHMTQGDNACQIAVSADGTTVWLHPGKRQYMFRYEVEKNQLYQLPIVKTFETDLEAEDLFDHYSVTEEEQTSWHSNYLYEEYKDEKGFHTAYIYLYIPDGEEQRLGNMQCVWDDMVYILCRDGIWPADAGTEREFPLLCEGIAEEVVILYDEPCAYSRISDAYGSRVHPVTGDTVVHEGIDYAAEEGTEITAAADGIVYARGSSDEYGNYVVLLHANNDMTYYFHCREITVEEGAQVKRGEKIAAVGNTGRSTGAHLHFALSQDGVFVDPAEYMRSDREG